MSKVYLLHLNTKLKHAGHYIGYSQSARTLPARLAHHANGTGARFTQVCIERGITWQVAKVWDANRTFERKLKNRKGASRFCPICKGEPQ